MTADLDRDERLVIDHEFGIADATFFGAPLAAVRRTNKAIAKAIAPSEKLA
jgi:hypothetical protein